MFGFPEFWYIYMVLILLLWSTALTFVCSFALLQVPIGVTFGLCQFFRAEYVEHICDNVELALTYNDL